MNNLTKDNFQLQWNPQTDESYIKIVGIDSMQRDSIIRQILHNQKIVQEIQKAKQSMVKILQDPNVDNIKEILTLTVLRILNDITDDDEK